MHMDVCLLFKCESYKFHGSYKKHTLVKVCLFLLCCVVNFQYTILSEISFYTMSGICTIGLGTRTAIKRTPNNIPRVST